jgi:hypothetical protein
MSAGSDFCRVIDIFRDVVHQDFGIDILSGHKEVDWLEIVVVAALFAVMSFRLLRLGSAGHDDGLTR